MDQMLQWGINSLNQGLNTAAQIAYASNTSKHDRAFTREMYEKQLQNARENWELQNQYNSPSAQMERLIAAGLNPNLVYGSGAVVGNSTSQPSNASYNAGYSPRAKFDFDMLSSFIALRQADANLKSTQLDNEYKQRTLDDRVVSQSALKDKIIFLANMAEDEREIKRYERTAAADIANIRNMIVAGRVDDVDIFATGRLDDGVNYMQDLHDSPLYAAVQGKMLSDGITPVIMGKKLDILEYELGKILPEKLKGMQIDNAINAVKQDLWESGINPNDPAWMRIIALLLGRWLGIDINSISDSLSNW